MKEEEKKKEIKSKTTLQTIADFLGSDRTCEFNVTYSDTVMVIKKSNPNKEV